MPWQLHLLTRHRDREGLSRMSLDSLPGNIPDKDPLEHDMWSAKSKVVATPMDCNLESSRGLYHTDRAEEEVSVGSRVAHVRNARYEA